MYLLPGHPPGKWNEKHKPKVKDEDYENLDYAKSEQKDRRQKREQSKMKPLQK